MKFILPLFLSLSLASAISSDTTYFLSAPSFTQVDAQTVFVTFTHGPGTDGTNPGLTHQIISVGDCTDGAGLTKSSPGITKNYSPSDIISGQTYQTSYSFSLDLEDAALDVTPDGSDTGTLKLCVAHFFSEGGYIPNFQMTDLTIIFDLLVNSISFVTFQTAVNSPGSSGTSVTIGAKASQCTADSPPVNQNEIVCFTVCPDEADDVGDGFVVTAIISAEADMGGTNQALTTGAGAVTNGNLVSVEDGTDTDCKEISFYLDSNFFLTASTAVQLSGSALLADKGNTPSKRRLGSISRRALTSQVTESEFELEIELVKPEDSAAVAVTVTHFALVGAAGAALMV